MTESLVSATATKRKNYSSCSFKMVKASSEGNREDEGEGDNLNAKEADKEIANLSLIRWLDYTPQR